MLRNYLGNLSALLGMGAAVGTLFGYFGTLYWLLDLFAHFRVQYAAALVVCILGVGLGNFGRKHLILPILCVALLANAIALAPYAVPKAAAQQSADLRVLTFNVQARNADFDSITEAIETNSADIVLVIEVIPELAARLEQLDSYPHTISMPRSGFFGIVMLSKKPWLDSEILDKTGASPSLLATIDVKGQPVKILGMHPYPPFNGGNTDFRNTQLAHAAQLAQDSAEPFILLGDFNATPWSAPMRQIFSETDLTNSAENFGLQASWMSRNPLLGIPIDHVLVSAEFTTINHTVGASVGSDHFPITVDLAFR